MTSHSNFIFQERRELYDDVLKIVNAERNDAYDLRRIELQEDKIHFDPLTLNRIYNQNQSLDGQLYTSNNQHPYVEKKVIQWIFPDKQTLEVHEIFHDTQCLEVKKILESLYRPHELLEYNNSYSYRIFYRTKIQVNKDHPVFNKFNKYLKHLKDILLLKDDIGNCLNPVNKTLLESSITFLETYQENLIHASHNKDYDLIGYLLSPKVLLIGETSDVYQISKETAFRLLSVKDIYGTSSSQENETELNFDYNEENVRFKMLFNSISEPRPGNEFISYALSKTLTNEPLITPSILIKLLEVPQVPHLPTEAIKAQLEGKSIDIALQESGLVVKVELLNYFIQAIRNVGDQDIHKNLKKKEDNTDVQDDTMDNNSILETFDKENLSWHFILNLFLQPGEGQSDNYAVEVKNGKNIIIGIENDKIFYPNIYVSKDFHYVNIQCFLYAWKEFMELDINENVRDKVLRISPSTFLLNWTSMLELQNNVYENLMDKGYINSKEAKALKLPLMFTKDIVSKVFELWEKIQNHLSSRTKSHNGILKHIDPFIASWYKTLRDEYSSILEVEYITSKGFDENGKRIYLKDILEGDLKEQLNKMKDSSRVPIQTLPVQQFYESIMQLFKKNHYMDHVWHELESLHVHDDIYQRLYKYNPNTVDTKDSKGKYPLDYALEAYIERNDDKPFILLVSLNAKQMTSNYKNMYFKMEEMIEKDPSFKYSEFYTSYLTWIHRYGGKCLWEITLTQMFPEYSGEGSYITGSHCGKRYLRNEIKEQLNDDNNIKYGRRKVKQVDYKGFKVHIKYYPELPSNEEAVGILYREIIGWGTPYGELFKLEDGTPVWISLNIEGQVLQDVMDQDSNEHNNIYESQLDKKYMSDIILMSMLINPEDGKPDKFILEHINNTYRLVCIDNEHCFVPAYVEKPHTKDSSGQLKPVCQVKSILYCFPHMNEPIHEETKEQFILLHIDELMKRWLNQLNELNESYIKMFNNNEMKQLLTQNEDKCFTRVGFQSTCIEHIYTKFYKLQNWLRKKNDTKLTHIDLLMKLEPYLGSRYKNVLNDTSFSVWDKFECVDIALIGNSIEVPNDLILESSIKLPIGKTLLECIQNEEELSPKEALRLLNEILTQNTDENLSPNQFVLDIPLEDKLKKVEEYCIQNEVDLAPSGALRLSNNITQNKDDNLSLKQFVSDTQLEDKAEVLDFIEYDSAEQLNIVKQLSNRKLKHMTIRNCKTLNDDVTQNTDEELSLKQFVSDIQLEDNLKDFDFEDYDYTEQLNLVKQLSNRKLKHMTIRNCEALNDDIISTFQLKQLCHVEWMDVDITIKSLILLTSKAKYLESLYLYKCNKLNHLSMPLFGVNNMIQFETLKTLKIHECSNIKHVLVDGPNISTLVIRNCEHLNRFNMKGPKLQEISVQNTENLKSFVLSESPLSSQKLYKLTYSIPGADIKFDKCSGNRHDNFVNIIKEMDDITYDRYIRVLDNDPKMTTFHYNKSLANDIIQHIQNNTHLNELSFEGCNLNISSLEAISKMFNLRTLNLSNNNIEDKGCEHFSKITSLSTLNLSRSNIGGKGCKHLSKISTLTTLNLSENNIGPHGCSHLSKNTTLTTLNLSYNIIGDKGCKHLSKNTTLTTLNLSENCIGPSGCEYLSKNTTLTTLNLSYNNIEDKGCEHLSKNTTLTTLNLSDNIIGDKGCKHLSKISTLATLNLSYNNIGENGCEQISKISTLTTLNLSNNHIGDKGCKHLSKIYTLTTLNLSTNNIGPNGCEYLLDITTLSILNLSINNIGDNGCYFLSKNTTLTTLNLSYNNIGEEGCTHLSKITYLKTLNLSRNHIGDKGCKHLSKIYTLTTLNLYNNNIGDLGCEYLSKNTNLTMLNLSENKIGPNESEYLSKNTNIGYSGYLQLSKIDNLRYDC